MSTLLAIACTTSPTPAQTAAPDAAPAALRARALPAAELPLQFTEATGRPRLVHLWASWCAPCVAELPTWRMFLLRHPEADVRMISVDVPSLHETKVKPMLASRGLTMIDHLLLTSENPVAELRATPGWAGEIPHTIAIDAAGAVTGTWPRPLSLDELDRALATATH
jgi:thiol-disulfide isomerase/thioredoxin